MPDTRYRSRIVPATKGTAWKVVSPEGKTVSVGTDPADAIDRLDPENWRKLAFPEHFKVAPLNSFLASSWSIQ